MVGRAVETTVWSSAARNMPSMRAPMITRTRRWVSRPAGSCAMSVALFVIVASAPFGQ